MLDTPPVPRPTCFVLGDLSRPEFRMAREWLRAQAQPVYGAGNAPDPLGGWIADTDPDVVIIVQTRPGEHRPTLVDRLRRRFPLTPLVVLTGSWCEGETRSGHPLASTWRIPWYDFVPRMSWAWQNVPAGHPSRLHRPLLISDEDRWHQDLQCDETLRGFRVGIVSAAQAKFESLRDTLVPLGLPVTRSTARDWSAYDETQHPRVLLWDDAAGPRTNGPGIVAMIEDHPPTIPGLALLTFPRVQTVERLFAAGIRGVMPKPFHVADLLWHLRRLAAETGDFPAQPGTRP